MRANRCYRILTSFDRAVSLSLSVSVSLVVIIVNAHSQTYSSRTCRLVFRRAGRIMIFVRLAGRRVSRVLRAEASSISPRYGEQRAIQLHLAPSSSSSSSFCFVSFYAADRYSIERSYRERPSDDSDVAIFNSQAIWKRAFRNPGIRNLIEPRNYRDCGTYRQDDTNLAIDFEGFPGIVAFTKNLRVSPESRSESRTGMRSRLLYGARHPLPYAEPAFHIAMETASAVTARRSDIPPGR